jgi:hypothetical protein
MQIKGSLNLLLLVFLTGSMAISCKKQFQADPLLSDWVEQDNYGNLYDALSNNRESHSKGALLYYDIILKSVLNLPEESNQLIRKFRQKYTFNDTTAYYLTLTEYNNYVKLCDYTKLKDIGGELIDKYQPFIDSLAYVELKDDHRIYLILEKEQPISVNKIADTELPVKRDLAGYTLMTVKASNDSTVDFIFDTGANVNALTETSAKKLNLRIIPNSDIFIMGATGMRNHAQIGMADSITIGNVKIRNAEFVVFADSLFTFANGLYVINGVVGFPIFSRFEEITYTDSTIVIPKIPTLEPAVPNMFIEADDYILSIGYKGKNYPFFFDTGNDKTFLKRNFYNIDSATFMSLNDTVFAMGGVGEVITMKARIPDEVTLQFSGKDFRLDKPYVEMQYEKMSRHLYGSIGKDFMYLYPKRTMSFKQSRLEFE